MLGMGWLERKGEQVATKAVIGGILRTLLAAGAGAGVLAGYEMSDGEVETLAGGLSVVLIGGWSTWQKIQDHRHKQALALAAEK